LREFEDMTVILLASAPLCAAASAFCQRPTDCGETTLCGSTEGALPLAVNEPVKICVGFEGGEHLTSSNGHKAVFEVNVDRYAALSVDALRTIMSDPWPLKEQFSHMWVGMQGRRTIGQKAGVRSAASTDGCNSSSAADAARAREDGRACYGWALHNKPVIRSSNQLSSGLTVIVHLNMGVVNRIVWDSSCALCQQNTPEVACLPDQTEILCVAGPCNDCYVQLRTDRCSAVSAPCSPKVDIAWVGTDRHGQPLLSAGQVLSRFAAHSVSNLGKQLFQEVKKLGGDLTTQGHGPPPLPAPPPLPGTNVSSSA